MAMIPSVEVVITRLITVLLIAVSMIEVLMIAVLMIDDDVLLKMLNAECRLI